MNLNDRNFLGKMCQMLESRFPGVVAAYEGFATTDLGGDDDVPMVEVFNVPDSGALSLVKVAAAMITDHIMAGGSFAAVSTWTSEESEEFAADIVAIKHARQIEHAHLVQPTEVAMKSVDSCFPDIGAIESDTWASEEHAVTELPDDTASRVTTVYAKAA